MVAIYSNPSVYADTYELALTALPVITKGSIECRHESVLQ
jgi:hypothetical protein